MPWVDNTGSAASPSRGAERRSNRERSAKRYDRLRLLHCARNDACGDERNVCKCTKGPERCSEPFGICSDQPLLRAGRFVVVVVRRDDDAADDSRESEDRDDPARAAFEFALTVNSRSSACRRSSRRSDGSRNHRGRCERDRSLFKQVHLFLRPLDSLVESHRGYFPGLLLPGLLRHRLRQLQRRFALPPEILVNSK